MALVEQRFHAADIEVLDVLKDSQGDEAITDWCLNHVGTLMELWTNAVKTKPLRMLRRLCVWLPANGSPENFAQSGTPLAAPVQRRFQ